MHSDKLVNLFVQIIEVTLSNRSVLHDDFADSALDCSVKIDLLGSVDCVPIAELIAEEL